MSASFFRTVVFLLCLFSVASLGIIGVNWYVDAGTGPTRPDTGRGYAAGYRLDFDRLQKASVTLGRGSGVIVHTENGLYAWTAAHVTVQAKKEDGTYTPMQLLSLIPRVSEFVDVQTSTATVVGACQERDVSLVKLEDQELDVPTVFFRPEWMGDPALGDQVYFCGCSNGAGGIGTWTTGIMSFVGRRESAVAAVDQCSAPTFPGASGGPLFDSQGYLIGLVLGGHGESFSLFAPARSIRAFARQNKVEWAVPTPVDKVK